MYLDLVDGPSVFTPEVVGQLAKSAQTTKVNCPLKPKKLLRVLRHAESRHRSLSETIDKRALQKEVKTLGRLHAQARKLQLIWRELDAQTRYEIARQDFNDKPYKFVVDAPPSAHSKPIEDDVADCLSRVVKGSRKIANARKLKFDGRTEIPSSLLAFVQIIHDAWLACPRSEDAFGSEFQKNIEETDWEPKSAAARLIVEAAQLLGAGYKNQQIRTAIKYAKRHSKASRTA